MPREPVRPGLRPRSVVRVVLLLHDLRHGKEDEIEASVVKAYRDTLEECMTLWVSATLCFQCAAALADCLRDGGFYRCNKTGEATHQTQPFSFLACYGTSDARRNLFLCHFPRSPKISPIPLWHERMKLSKAKTSLSEGHTMLHRAQSKDMQLLLSKIQVGPGRAVRQEHDKISSNPAQTITSGTEYCWAFGCQ